MKVSRVVSLLPSCTEIVCALGARARLVGRSHECNFPAEVQSLPVCTAAKLTTNASSAEIDREVKSLLKNALSIYSVDAEQMCALRPDLVLTQSQCEVCAVSLSEVEAALAQCVGQRSHVLSLAPMRFPDLWDNIRDVAKAMRIENAGKNLCKRLKVRVADIIVATSQITRRPSVACIEWVEPLMAAGNWVPELVELAGGLSLFGEPGRHSPWLNWEAVQEHNPEVIILMPCGFNLERARSETPALTNRPDWLKLRAVRASRVYLTDGSQFFNRPGPRLIDSLEILAEILHPKRFHFGHEGRGWQRLA